MEVCVVKHSTSPGSRRRVRGTEISREPRFWYGYFRLALGQRDPDFDPGVLSTFFGVDDEEALAWWDEFTGWYDGMLDASDGQVEEPGLLELPLANGGSLIVEAHPGDVYVRRRSVGGSERDEIANFGPHAWVPEWTLEGVARQVGGDHAAFLVLAPLVRLKPEYDPAAAEARFADACVGAGILGPSVAQALAREWVRLAKTESPET